MRGQIIELKVEGMDCANCAKSISRFLERKGLENVSVNFQTKEVRFEENNELLKIDAIVSGIHKLGFTVVEEGTALPWWDLKKRLIIASIFTLPLIIHHVLMLAGVENSILHNPYLQFFLSLPVYVIGVDYFGRSAWKSVREGIPNMDVLIFIGATAAFIYSLVGLYLQEAQYIFFETAATIITLVLLGNWMENRAVAQTTHAVGALSALQKTQAKKKLASGEFQIIDAQLLKPKDIVLIGTGEKIPADGMVLSGTASVDESMLSGESKALYKEEGSAVVGASLIIEGNLEVEVQAVGRSSVLGQMIELVKSAQNDKPDIQRLADKISAIFVPAVLIIAFLTFMVSTLIFEINSSKALMNAIAVLVISCPCAMGLATPTAVMVGVGRLARNGILVKGGQSLELFSKIKYLLLDKTGTLTEGNFKIDQIKYKAGDPEEINQVIYQIEQYSAHPIAKSLVENLKNKVDTQNLIPLDQIREEKGIGITATNANGDLYKIGSFRLIPKEEKPDTNRIFFLKNKELLAEIYLKDQIRMEATHLIDTLHKNKITPVIVSGDHQNNTQELAEKLQVQEYYAQQLPAQKLELVDTFQQKGLTAMLGDGINDAPALAKADIGISISEASQVAIQSAQIVLLNNDLSKLKKALGISKETVLTIKQNLFWAFAYNLVAIPIAAMGFLNPMWGALFMAISDVIVIGNSVRLRFKKIPS